MSGNGHWLVALEARPRVVERTTPPRTRCIYCGEALTAMESHLSIPVGDACANIRLHARIVDLEAEIRRLEALIPEEERLIVHPSEEDEIEELCRD